MLSFCSLLLLQWLNCNTMQMKVSTTRFPVHINLTISDTFVKQILFWWLPQFPFLFFLALNWKNISLAEKLLILLILELNLQNSRLLSFYECRYTKRDHKYFWTMVSLNVASRDECAEWWSASSLIKVSHCITRAAKSDWIKKVKKQKN